LVSESFYDVVNNNAGKDNGNIDKSREKVTTTRFGRSVRPPAKYNEYVKIGIKKNDSLDEYALIMSTEELHVMKCNKAMKSKDRKNWIKDVQEEHDRMVKSGVWTAVNKNTLKATDKA
jgi:hypothetical protein